MPRSLAFSQWLRALQRARRLSLDPQDNLTQLPLKQRPRGSGQVALAGLIDSVNCGAAVGAWPGAVRVAVVGAGLAGLTAAYQLRKAGLDVQVFEASERVGGRMRSVVGAVGEGLVTDLGGELVNSDHEDLHALAAELEVTLVPRGSSNNGVPEVGYFFAGARWSEARLAEALRPFAAQVAADAARLDQDWARWGPYFDRMSLADYLAQHRALLPTTPDMQGLVASLVRVEYGVGPELSSALQLLFLLPVVAGEHVELLSTSDEAWTFAGGAESLIQRLHHALGRRVQTHMALTRLERAGAAFELSFDDGQTVVADYVVLALPLAALRKVDVRIGLPATLRRFINEVNLGHNEKIVAGVNQRLWRTASGFEVEAWSDQSAALVWDASLRELQSQPNGALTFFLSDHEVAATEHGSADQHGQRLLQEYDALFPGLAASGNGNFLRTAWHKTSGILGGYTNLKPGQYTDFAAEWMYVESADPACAQDVHVDRLLLAGEHTSDEFYGFMNGAAQSGRLAAQWILKDVVQQAEIADQQFSVGQMSSASA